MHLIAQLGGIVALVLFCFAVSLALRNAKIRSLLFYLALFPAHWLDARRARRYREASEERPALPLNFRPVKPLPRRPSVTLDRLARLIHSHDQEEAGHRHE